MLSYKEFLSETHPFATNWADKLGNIVDKAKRYEELDGGKAFAAGIHRVPPASLTTDGKKKWLRDWDLANIASPIKEEVVRRESEEDLAESVHLLTRFVKDGKSFYLWGKGAGGFHYELTHSQDKQGQFPKVGTYMDSFEEVEEKICGMGYKKVTL